ncbi:SDR family oxidoreductase [Nocardia sp. NPDC059246]|uniref:SDR family oxidoreductase n=1 Tax=unclassified Nocardia TaxID=2637762 RepID=UPI0036C74CD2
MTDHSLRETNSIDVTTPRKVALVTGGGSGIGRAAALTLAGNGYHVVITGRTKQALVETAAIAEPGTVEPVVCDVTRGSTVAELFEHIKNHHGRLDLLFNNAGIGGPGVPVEDMTEEQWRAVVDTNLTGSFLCAQAAFRLMKAQQPQGGRIINNGSVSAALPRPHSVPYTATKHAITGLTKALSLDGRAYNIACGQIDVGNAATDMATAMQRGILQADGSTKIEPTMSVQHVADAVLQMASLPLEANVLFMTIMATAMPLIGRG